MASLGPEVIATIGSVKVTNTIITTLVTDVILLTLVYITHKNIKKVPGVLQMGFEAVFEYFYDLAENLAGNKAKVIFPWVMTFFLVIFATNILGLLPGVGSIGLFPKEKTTTQENAQKPTAVTEQKTETSDNHATEQTTETTELNKTAPVAEEKGHESEFIPLLRPSTSDFNMTLALAFISLIVTHTLSIKYTGIKDYISRFISLNPILLFVGLLEIVSEFIKMFSLSFRLFGNIYAGEVALHTVSTIHPLSGFLAPIPFLLLESIVAIVQALVFSMLTLVFMSILIKPHHGAEH